MKRLIIFIITLIFIFSTKINIYADSTPIRDEARSSQSQAVQYLKDHNAEQEFIDLVPFIYEYCEEVGVEPTLVVAQISLETNFFKSSLCKSHKNTSGMKTSRGGYRKFDTYEDAIKSEIDHLNLYAGYPKDSNSWLKGWCTSVEELGGKWAEDPKYSYKLKSIMEDIQSYSDCDFYSDDKKQTEPIVDESDKDKSKSGVDIIQDILNRNKRNSKAFDYIMSFIR